MRRASTWLLEKGIQPPSPSPDLIPAGYNKTLAENLQGNWNIERGHFSGLMDIHSDILLLTHKGAPFGKCGFLTTHNLPQKWAPFHIACYRRFFTK